MVARGWGEVSTGAVWFARGFDTAIQAPWLPWYPLPYMDIEVKEQKRLLGWVHEECGVLLRKKTDLGPASKNTKIDPVRKNEGLKKIN